MTIVLVMWLMAKYGQYGHFYPNMAILAIFGHQPYDQKYGHDGYPWKDNKKIKSPVKKSSDLDVWVKSYDQNMDFDFFEKIFIFSKIKNGSKIHFLVTKSKF